MRFIIPDFLVEAIGEKDITVDFTNFLIVQAEADIQKEQKQIAGLQEKYKAADLKSFLKKYIRGRAHSFAVDEDLLKWDAAETIIKNRYIEIGKLRRFLSAYAKKHPFLAKRER